MCVKEEVKSYDIYKKKKEEEKLAKTSKKF